MPSQSDIYGTRVGQLPELDPFDDLSKVVPGLSGLNSAASSAIMSKLRGQLSPETQAMLQDDAARYAAGSGMPGANAIPGTVPFNRGQRNLGRRVEDVQTQGLQLLNPFIQSTSSTQTVNPALEFERNLQNALNLSSPEPSAAGSHAEELFNKYLKMLTDPAGGTGGTQMPTYSYAPKTAASRPSTPSATSSGQRAISGASSFKTNWDGSPAGPNTSLWDWPGFGPSGYSGVLPAGSRGEGFMYAGPKTDAFDPAPTGNFYAGPAEGYLPELYPGWELDALESGWNTPSAPSPQPTDPRDFFDPLDYYLPPVML